MRTLLLPLGALVLAACSTSTPGEQATTVGPPAATPTVVTLATGITVYKSPTCGCCHEWEAYLRRHGYTVRSIPTEDMAAVKAANEIPATAESCHTAIIDGYAVEGHVPVEAIEDLLTQQPAIDGIALPGMPAGSPGMGGTKDGPFQILAVTGGATSAFGSY